MQGFCWVVTEDREVKSNEEPPKVKDSEIQARERRSQPTSFAFALALAWQARKKKKKRRSQSRNPISKFPRRTNATKAKINPTPLDFCGVVDRYPTHKGIFHLAGMNFLFWAVLGICMKMWRIFYSLFATQPKQRERAKQRQKKKAEQELIEDGESQQWQWCWCWRCGVERSRAPAQGCDEHARGANEMEGAF